MEDGLVLRRLVSFMESRETLLDDGQTLVLLSLKERLAINVLISYLQMVFLQYQKTPEKIICMLEFHLKSKRTIWKDKYHFYPVNTQAISLLKTLLQVSTIKEKGFWDCWKKVMQEKSMKSWYLAKTDCVVSDSNYLNGRFYKTIQNSWFTNSQTNHQNKNLLKTFLPFYKFLLVGGMEKEDIELIRSRKYRLKLNSIQKKTFKKWEQHYRWTYNKSIGLINNGNNHCVDTKNIISHLGPIEQTASTGNYYTKFGLRNLVTSEEVNCRNPWVLETGYNIRANASFEAHQAYKTNLEKVKSKSIKYFDLKYKRKRNITWTIGISKENIIQKDPKRLFIYESTGIVTSTEAIPEINKDCKLHFDGKYYYLIVPRTIEKRPSKAKNWFCSLDPGVRKFQTLYSPDGNESIIIGDRASTEIYKLLLKLDKCNDSTKEVKLRHRIKNLQKELHDKTSRFLCENYNNIYIPKLTKENDIISNKNRTIRKKTVRNMVVLAHCKFVEKLKTKANEYTNVNVHVITEEYTSQICLSCKKRTKRSTELYKCKYCGFQTDRDYLGSCNILLKQWGLLEVPRQDTANVDMRFSVM